MFTLIILHWSTTWAVFPLCYYNYYYYQLLLLLLFEGSHLPVLSIYSCSALSHRTWKGLRTKRAVGNWIPACKCPTHCTIFLVPILLFSLSVHMSMIICFCTHILCLCSPFKGKASDINDIWIFSFLFLGGLLSTEFSITVSSIKTVLVKLIQKISSWNYIMTYKKIIPRSFS